MFKCNVSLQEQKIKILQTSDGVKLEMLLYYTAELKGMKEEKQPRC